MTAIGGGYLFRGAVDTVPSVAERRGSFQRRAASAAHDDRQAW